MTTYIKINVEKNEKLLDQFKSIQGLVSDNNGWYVPENYTKALSVLEQIATISWLKRQPLPMHMNMPLDQIDRLIAYDFNQIKKFETKAGQLSKIDENDLLIISYNSFKKLCLTKVGGKLVVNTTNPLFKLPIRCVIADEASSVHSKDTTINRAMHAFKDNLSSRYSNKEVTILPVTATPFENNLNEVFELLRIGNPVPNPKEELITNNQIKVLEQLNHKTVEALADFSLLDKENSHQDSEHLLTTSFAQANILGTVVLQRMILELNFSDQQVKDQWDGQIPTTKITHVVVPYTHKSTQEAIQKISESFFTKGVSELRLFDLGLTLSRCRVSHLLPLQGEEKTSILKINNPEIKNSLADLSQQLDLYIKGDHAALDNFFFAKILIENEQIKQQLSKQIKTNVIYLHEVEREVVKLVLLKYYKKQVFDFGHNDQVRTQNLANFKAAHSNSVLLLPEKAGGLGLNINFADAAFVLNPWWNLAIERQSIARITRVGRCGERQIMKISYDDSQNDFVQKVRAIKENQDAFYLQKNLSLKDKFELWLTIQKDKALKNFILSSSKPGFYEFSGASIPILKKHASSTETSLEERIDCYLDTIKVKYQEADLQQIVKTLLCKPKFIPETSLNLADWKILPLCQTKTKEECKALAAFIAHPDNKQTVLEHLSYLGHFLATTSGREYNKIVTMARDVGDKNMQKLFELAKDFSENPEVAIYHYVNVNNKGCYQLQSTHSESKNLLGKLYIKQEQEKERIDILVPNALLKECVSIHKEKNNK